MLGIRKKAEPAELRALAIASANLGREKAVAELGGTVPAADAVLNRQDPPVACVAGSVSTARYAACASLLLPMPVPKPTKAPSWSVSQSCVVESLFFYLRGRHESPAV
jgi:hypothetical protein